MNDAASIRKREVVADPWKIRPLCGPRQPTLKCGRALTVDATVGPIRRLDLVEQVVGPADVAELFQLHVRTSWSPEPTLCRDATPPQTGPDRRSASLSPRSVSKGRSRTRRARG